MSLLEIFVFIVLFICSIAAIVVSSSAKRFGENCMDILQNRLKEYESEKGRNLATKEDIEEITQKVEEVKSAVTYSNKQRFNQIAEQEKVLLEILYDATRIRQSQNKLVLYLYDLSSRIRHDNLVESVNDTIAHFYHLSNVARLSMQIDGLEEHVEALSFATTLLAGNVSVVATNAANTIDYYNTHMDYAMRTDNPYKDSSLNNALDSKRQIESMRNKPIEGTKELSTAIDDYCRWLKELYGKEVFVFKSF